MKKIKITKKSIITSIYTFAILITIALAIFPNTNSKFLKDKKNVLAYNSNLPNPYKGSFTFWFNQSQIYASKKESIRLRVSFRRDLDNPSASYTITANNQKNKCSIADVPNASNNITIKNNIITFKNSTASREEIGYFDITCPVTEGEDIDVDGKISEAIAGESEFVYLSGIFPTGNDEWPKRPFTYNEYKDVVEPAENTIILSQVTNEKNAYSWLLEIIGRHLQKSDYASTYNLNQVIYEAYLNAKGITDTNEGHNKIIPSPLPTERFKVVDGITAICDSTKCIYSFDSNFEGYIKNHDWNINNQTGEYKYVFISKEDSVSIKDILNFSINKYIYNDTADIEYIYEGISYKKLILDYIDQYIIDNKKSVYSLNNLNDIPGVEILEDENSENKYSYVRLQESVIYYAYNYINRNVENNSIKIPYLNSMKMLDIFNSAISSTYSENVINYLNITTSNYNKKDVFKAILCKSNCSAYEETIYDNSTNEYYKITVTPNTNENIVNIVKYDSFEKTFNTTVTSDNINAALACISNETNACESFNEMYYNYKAKVIDDNTTKSINEFVSVDINETDIGAIKKVNAVAMPIATMLNPTLKEIIGSKYAESLISIIDKANALQGILGCKDQDICPNPYSLISYGKETIADTESGTSITKHNYLTIKVTPDFVNNNKVISINEYSNTDSNFSIIDEFIEPAIDDYGYGLRIYMKTPDDEANELINYINVLYDNDITINSLSIGDSSIKAYHIT